jgi:hypothetical protein
VIAFTLQYEASPCAVWNKRHSLSLAHRTVLLDRHRRARSTGVLAAHGLIDADALRQGVVLLGEVETPDVLKQSIVTYVEENAALFEAVKALAFEYALLGNDGLKRRSGLMEYKYDAA